jgi:hypothetical protein
VKALRLEELDRLAVRAIIESGKDEFVKCWDEFERLKNEVRLILAEFPVAKVHDPKAREVLSKVNSSDQFQLDLLLRRIEKAAGEKFLCDDVFEHMSFEEEDDLIYDFLYSWLRPTSYINDLCDIGSLVIGVPVPDHLHDFVDQARQCYAFQQYQAVYALCRTILEVAVRDVGQKKGKLPRDKGKVKHDVLRRFGEMKAKAVPKRLKSEVGEIYDRSSGLIHGNKTVGQSDAVELFRRTLITVQELYR